VPTAVWTGTLSFGLVAVPVRLLPATEPKDVRLHLYDRAGRRVRYERVVDDAGEPPAADASAAVEPASAIDRAPSEEHMPARGGRAGPGPAAQRPVAWEDVVRGRENERGEVVTVTHEELSAIRPRRSRTIDVEDFVDLDDVDPVYFDKTYYAIPAVPDAATPYVLLHRAMLEAGRVGIGRFVLRTKPHLVAVRPMREVLAVETLFFGDEVRDAGALVPGLGGARVDRRELDLAVELIETLGTEWDPSRYADTYREELLRILGEKEPSAAPPERVVPSTPSAVEQLMAALRDSVDAAKRRPARRAGRTKAG
jgi:DNA end-binding protein Ku